VLDRSAANHYSLLPPFVKTHLQTVSLSLNQRRQLLQRPIVQEPAASPQSRRAQKIDEQDKGQAQ
jgi:hypothetical protein